ncbi:MAG: gamma-glutamyl-gamma-aminobutyrate hydrolase family protein [Phormidesmis sp. CAN_BIN44]|nr:gamma-glutamyl-gamma-aminobutyrate hydrolase family protein [Phormidesmis sp. CAN_BIN44]
MASPIIGITTHSRNEAGELCLPGTYVDAVQAAGGTPILLPPNQPDPRQILQILDGLIFPGGGDINPILYGGTPHPTIYSVDPDRDDFEFALAKLALTASIPVLGICRGMQMLSVASGGDLVTHVPEIYGTAIAHRLDHPRRPTQHEVDILPESRLFNILGTSEATIVTWHHQAVRNLSSDWNVAAKAPDGLIEAIEHQRHPWMFGLQWHPEMSAQDPAHQRLFQAFIDAATRRQR